MKSQGIPILTLYGWQFSAGGTWNHCQKSSYFFTKETEMDLKFFNRKEKGRIKRGKPEESVRLKRQERSKGRDERSHDLGSL